MEAWWGHLPLCPFKRGQRWRRCLFITVSYVISWFIKIDLKQIDTAVWARGKFRLSFYNFGYYFFGQHCWWTETNLFGNDFFVFLSFHCPRSFTAPPALPLLQSPWICALCQQTSPKYWFANVNMTSYCDVKNSVYPITMTTTRHCSILEFGRGASNQAVAPDITRPLHATELDTWTAEENIAHLFFCKEVKPSYLQRFSNMTIPTPAARF